MKMMKLAAGVAALALGTSALAVQDTDLAGSPAAAEIVAAIAITNDGGLHFGDIVASGVLGTVAVDTAGARLELGGVTLGNGGAARAAQFTVTGDSGATFDVTLPTSILISSGGDDMTVDSFTENSDGTLTGGTEQFEVGATLHVAAAQPSGSYSGTFDVIATYN
jgi:hypothetical protein